MRQKIICLVLAGTFLIAGCEQRSLTSPTSKQSECSTAEAEIIWPQLQVIEPEQSLPGGEIKIIASGGYQIECGNFYNESDRLFAVYFNQDQVGMLSCMVNYCEVILKVPEDIQSGTHIISTEGGSQIEIEIVEEKDLDFLEQGGKIPASAKGYELYSWLDEKGWHFTLISGTNRSKSADEILSPESSITPDGWVKITVSNVQNLKSIFEHLPVSQEVFWLEGTRLEGFAGDKTFSFPPEETIQQMRLLSEELGLMLNIVR
jgi:hypothetical protein